MFYLLEICGLIAFCMYCPWLGIPFFILVLWYYTKDSSAPPIPKKSKYAIRYEEHCKLADAEYIRKYEEENEKFNAENAAKILARDLENWEKYTSSANRRRALKSGGLIQRKDGIFER